MSKKTARFADQVFADIRNYPIFEVGTWNGLEFTDEDLEDIAKNFEELSAEQHVPLKLGHNDEQPLTDGEPALGWIKNLRKVGKQLVADFENVPHIIKEAISKRLYRAVSIELLMNVKHKGKKYRNVLDAVAILGATPPAVRTLPDLSAYLASRSVAFDDSGRRVVFETSAGKEGGDDPDAKSAIRKRVREGVLREYINMSVKDAVDN